MATIGEIANDAKALLEDIKANTNATKNNTNAMKTELVDIKAHIVQLNATDQIGFQNLAQGIGVLVSLGVQANGLAATNIQQNETIICWLGNMASMLCEIQHHTEHLSGVADLSLARTVHIDRVVSLVHARETLEVAAQERLEQRLEECCPDDRETLAPCPTPCESPKVEPYRPVEIGWKPVHFDTPNKPK